jgi:cobalt/nickel transport system permease protein
MEMHPLPYLKPFEMHIPDGFLSVTIAFLLWGISIVLIMIALRNSRNSFSDKQIPLMGIMAAFIFAAQMINFPIAGGTSGHFLGGVLAAITLGPWAGMLVMTSVIAVQGLLFQDGGLLVMGANIFNMGLLTVLIGYGFYRAVLSQKPWVKLAVIGIAAWLAVMAGALATSLELWLSGTSSLQIVVPAMLGVHALIGIGEALITIGAFAFIVRTKPDLITATEKTPKGGKTWILGGILTALLVVLLSPFASAEPDGLERIAENLGFISQGAAAPYQILPDYTLPILGSTSISTIIAGIIGAAVVGLTAIVIVRLIRKPAN